MNKINSTLTNENALNFKKDYTTKNYYNDIHKYHVFMMKIMYTRNMITKHILTVLV